MASAILHKDFSVQDVDVPPSIYEAASKTVDELIKIVPKEYWVVPSYYSNAQGMRDSSKGYGIGVGDMANAGGITAEGGYCIAFFREDNSKGVSFVPRLYNVNSQKVFMPDGKRVHATVFGRDDLKYLAEAIGNGLAGKFAQLVQYRKLKAIANKDAQEDLIKVRKKQDDDLLSAFVKLKT